MWPLRTLQYQPKPLKRYVESLTRKLKLEVRYFASPFPKTILQNDARGDFICDISILYLSSSLIDSLNMINAWPKQPKSKSLRRSSTYQSHTRDSYRSRAWDLRCLFSLHMSLLPHKARYSIFGFGTSTFVPPNSNFTTPTTKLPPS